MNLYASTPATGSARHKGPGRYLAAGVGYGRIHEPNPILVEFRRMIRDDWDIREGELWMYAGSWVDLMDEDPHMSERINWGTLAGTEQPAIDHARRVLTRLARFQEHA